MSKTTNPLSGKFDAVVDALAGAPVQPQVASWGVTADEIMQVKDARLDAGSYEPGLTAALDELAAGAKELVPLGELAHVSLGKWFERVFTDDPEHGVPYCNPTDLLNLMAFGVPQATRYLSPATKTDIDLLLIREGWLVSHNHADSRVICTTGSRGRPGLLSARRGERSEPERALNRDGGRIDRLAGRKGAVGSVIATVLPDVLNGYTSIEARMTSTGEGKNS